MGRTKRHRKEEHNGDGGVAEKGDLTSKNWGKDAEK